MAGVFTTLDEDTGNVHFQGGESDALYVAIRRTTLRGCDHLVQSSPGVMCWYVEADTKVDDNDPTFPAIVHYRGND